MKRTLRVAVAGLLLVGTIEAGRLATPDVSVACSCAVQRSIIAYIDHPGAVVVVGDVGRIGADGAAPFTVAQVLFGDPILIPQVVIEPHEFGICGPSLMAGRVVFVGSFADGVISPRVCAPFHQVASPEGQRLLAEATAVFGGPGTAGDPPAEGLALPLLLGAVFGIAALLFGGVAVLARRGRPSA